MPETTALAKRLVEVSRNSSRREQVKALDSVGHLSHEEWEWTGARAAVVAVLRELDAVLEEERRDYLSQERLRALADSIEKGLAQ